MKRFVLAVTAVVLAALTIGANGRFDSKLSKDQQILQVLNRMTFGPRPGDIEQVRRVGEDKWIQLQLHPERIAENPALEERLRALETLQLPQAEIVKNFAPRPVVPPQIFTPLFQLLPAEQMRRVQTGTAEQRAAVLKSLDPEKRKQVLASMPVENLEGLPEYQEEAKKLRQERQEQQQKEIRKLRPQLPDLLSPDQVRIAQRGTFEERSALFASLDPETLKKVAGAMQPRGLSDFPKLRREGMATQQPPQLVLDDLREARIYRAVYSNRQLQEVLVDFWFNHFNVFDNKAQDRMLLTSYERDAIRPNVFGHFKDLLLATARHPAMLYYLDNWESMTPDAMDVGPFAPGGGMGVVFVNGIQPVGQKRGINENYGRELMELHTLGVKGGYTQQDVINVARCFTGWTVAKPGSDPQFRFADFMHDKTEKTVLGHKIPAGGGEQDGLTVIDILAHHPSTAKFISTKLARRFVADDPPPELVNRMAQTFLKTDGDLRAVMNVMFTSREFVSQGAWEAKIKSPFEMVVSAVRAMDADVSDGYMLVQKVADLGEPLYSKEEPTGYPDSSETWLSTAALLARINFANALAANQIAGVRVKAPVPAPKDAAALARAVLGRDPSPETRAALESSMQGKPLNPTLMSGVVMSSPEFQRR